VTTIVLWLRGIPAPPRYAIEGAVFVGLIGSIVGLVIGLCVNVPTAPFAVVELGLPATVLGGVAGLAAGGVVTLARRAKRNDR
jgi:ABC-type antimicrobial peptide transport system permease subunit